jgi:hypothetical protein
LFDLRRTASGSCSLLLPMLGIGTTFVSVRAGGGVAAFSCPLLLGATPVTVECLHLHRKRAGELIKSPFRTVLLGNRFNFGEAASERHAHHVDGRHLGRKHQHEIEPVLVEVPAVPTCVGELAHNAVLDTDLVGAWSRIVTIMLGPEFNFLFAFER